MNFEYYNRKINKKTTGRYDVTPLFENYEMFNNLINDMIGPFKTINIAKVVGIDAIGFILGPAIALELKSGFVVIRKEGKLPSLPGTTIKTSFVDYTKTKKSFEMNKGSIKSDEKVLIVDDWIETGAQVQEAIHLIEKQRGKVVGITAIASDNSKRTKDLFDKYNGKVIRTSK